MKRMVAICEVQFHSGRAIFGRMAHPTFQIVPQPNHTFSVNLTTLGGGGVSKQSPVLTASMRPPPGLCRPNVRFTMPIHGFAFCPGIRAITDGYRAAKR